MATGKKVAVISCEVLAGLFGEQVEVRRSQVEGKKYPLYLSTPAGPVPLNTKRAQDFILDHARFLGAPEPDPAELNAIESEPDPVAPGSDPVAPGPDPVESGRREHSGFLKWIGDFDE